jgi:beta-lactamase class A
VTAATKILNSPAGATVATFATPFMATLAGDAMWQGTTLWEHIIWRNLLETRDGWVQADSVALSNISFAGPEIAEVDALSPQLASYVNHLGDNAAMAVYVPGQHRYYEFNANLALETASTIKIVILVTLLSQAEAQGRPLTDDEQAEAASMIEFSDNDAAQGLFDEEGGNDGIASYMSSIGINDVGLTENGFGTFTMPPTAMIQLLEDLRTSAILNPGDCQYVLSLMANVESDEQMGLGDTAPGDATVQLKDGFGLEDDGLNVMVTVGILTYHGQVYDVAVFTRREMTVQQGTTYVNTICQDIALALLGQK